MMWSDFLELISSSPRLARFVVFVVVMGWPTVAITLYLERSGLWANAYTEEHNRLFLVIERAINNQADILKMQNDMGKKQDRQENILLKTAIAQQQTCIKINSTKEEMKRCVGLEPITVPQ